VVVDLRAGVNRIHSNSLNYPPNSFTASDYDSLGIPRSVQSVMPQFGAAPVQRPAQPLPSGREGSHGESSN